MVIYIRNAIISHHICLLFACNYTQLDQTSERLRARARCVFKWTGWRCNTQQLTVTPLTSLSHEFHFTKRIFVFIQHHSQTPCQNDWLDGRRARKNFSAARMKKKHFYSTKNPCNWYDSFNLICDFCMCSAIGFIPIFYSFHGMAQS